MQGRVLSWSLRSVCALALISGGAMTAAQTASAGTPSSFLLTSGSLTISQPASASIGSAAVGSTSLTGKLGTVTVTDGRGLLTASWTATVTATNFTTGGGSTYETVTSANISYSAGVATSITGVGTFTPGTLASLASSGTAGIWAGAGSNSVSWNPSITFTLSASQIAGTYSGTITHSVA